MKAKEILINRGCIVKFKDGQFANFFKNSLGNFLVIDKCIAGFNIDKDYNDDLLYNNRSRSYCDIEEIYEVKNPCFFQSDFKSLMWSIKTYLNGYSKHKPFEIIFKRQ